MIDRIENLFKQDQDITIVCPFEKNGYWISGKIQVKHKGVTLSFDTQVPSNYPYTQPHSDNISINFINKQLIGYNHINGDGSVCFHPEKDDDFERKFKNEIKDLKQWIHDYFLLKKEDPRYTYLMPKIEGSNISTLFFATDSKTYKKGDSGLFTYAKFSSQKRIINKEHHLIYESYFRLAIDKDTIEPWSGSFVESLIKDSNKFGVWYYIEKEPINYNEGIRVLVESWDELESYLSESFINKLYNIIKERAKKILTDNQIFFLLGYKIPTANNYETHWQLIKIPINQIPIKGEKIGKDTFKGKLLKQKINWADTKNVQYDRFFGRGRLSDQIVNSKILLVGIGALGSSLAEILVRGGIRDLVIDDFDNVKTGNLCRANFTLYDLNCPKVQSLKSRLNSISPYINIMAIDFKINVISQIELENILNKRFDIIFDCSTDPEITLLLDGLNFKGRIYSLGLTNKAKQLTCITGNKMSDQTAVLYEYLENEPAIFFEGTGCGYPTFEASFNDINTLLNLSIKKINEEKLNKSKSNSFIIENYKHQTNEILIKDYLFYNQKDLSHSILIPLQLVNRLNEILTSYFPNEFGGIFVGFKSLNYNATVIEAIIIPDRFENGRSFFVRHPASLNKRIEIMFEKHNGKIDYVGEFHSHPDSTALPSSTDIKAMAEISANQEIKTNEPVLMISETTSSGISQMNFFIYKNDKLNLYERQN
jgi:molybdopterin/thiamine biosynthesis adenylyltransferase/proteasome lid subunit RPN8/RPN11